MIRLALTGIHVLLVLSNIARCEIREPNVDSNCDCGSQFEKSQMRIVGGELAIPRSHPWIVGILKKGVLYCGGVLINRRYVLTAGHCVFRVNPKDVTLRIGVHNIEKRKSGHTVPASSFVFHEEFSRKRLYDYNDIALIRMKRQVGYSVAVQPICLPRDADRHYSGQETKIVGWGRVQVGAEPSKYLRQATVRVMNYDECKKSKVGQYLLPRMLCAYADDTDACQGDSGGPLLRQRDSGKYETIGIVSWGMGCAQRGHPGVYVKLADYLAWIYSHTADSAYCLNE